jgi:hypothetical protein
MTLMSLTMHFTVQSQEVIEAITMGVWNSAMANVRFTVLNFMSKNAKMDSKGKFFISKKKRVGADLCMAECPHGWPDLGDQCLKVGHLELIPFPWAIGDGQSSGHKDPATHGGV